MRYNINLIKIIVIGLTSCLFLSLLVGIVPISTDTCSCQNCNAPGIHMGLIGNGSRHSDTLGGSKHRLAILVPFRERFEELLQFVPHMGAFLSKQRINYHIFVLHQIDRYRFNRASLINVGFLFTKAEFDYMAMHDVDLLPLNDNLRYDYPADGPLHIASPEFHPKYHYQTFVGGILLVKREHFKQMNGMSNMYWGWGLEDDEFFLRIRDAGLPLSRPKNITTGVENTLRHVHDRKHRKRDTEKCFNQKEVTRKRDRKTGVDTVKYKINNTNILTIDSLPVTVINIMLECDFKVTPWCDCTSNLK